MNPLKKLSIAAAAALPAVALFVGAASAVTEDHVTNGGFNINAKGWTPNENATIAKHDGFPMGVLTNVAKGTAASTATATQCMTVLPSLDVQFSGRAFIPENQKRTGSATFQVQLFADEKCNDFLVGAELPALSDTGVWKEFNYNPVPWPGNVAHSARVTMVVHKDKKLIAAKAPFQAFFDDIKVTQFYLLTEDDIEDEDDCQCAPAEEEEPAEPAAPTDDGPIPAEPSGGAEDDDAPIPAEPVGGDGDGPVTPEPAQPTDEPEDAEDEPAAPAQPAPQVQGSDEDNQAAAEDEPDTAAPQSNEDSSDGDETVDDADTSEQYELTNEDDENRELGRGQAIETPGAPETGFSVQATKDLIGADELGLLGGALAFFGLVLAGLAIKRERSNN